MTGAFIPLCCLTICWVGLLVFGHARVNRTLVWAAKPAASSGFLLACYSAGALDSVYGRWVFAAQVFGWMGDLLLLPKQRAIFLLGMMSFMLGHLVLVGAFITYTPFNAVMGAGAVACLTALGAWLHNWVIPHVPSSLKLPVRLYVAIISIMVAAAAGTLDANPHPWLLGAGTTLFYLSDICVARQRFVQPSFVNQALGLPLYYAAQLMLAASVT